MLGGCQNIGHRTGMTDGAGSELWVYNVVRSYGSVHQDQRINNTSTETINRTTTYVLDFAGNVVQMVFPQGARCPGGSPLGSSVSFRNVQVSLRIVTPAASFRTSGLLSQF